MTKFPGHHFSAVIEAAGGGGAFVSVPFDVEAEFGSKRPKIRATIDGEAYRGTLVRMGTPCHLLLILKEIRGKIGKQPGDTVSVTIEPDREPRVVEPPADFRKALRAAPAARTFFDKLSYTHRKEYVRWIDEAKRAETRAARIGKAVAMLLEKKRRS
jgi:hypothetical protein